MRLLTSRSGVRASQRAVHFSRHVLRAKTKYEMRDCRAGNGSQVVLRRSALRSSQLLKPPTLLDTRSVWRSTRSISCSWCDATRERSGPGVHDRRMIAVGFEPTPLRTGAWSQRLRPLGQTVLSRWPLVMVGPAVGISSHATTS